MTISPPQTLDQLLERARRLQGNTIAALVDALGVSFQGEKNYKGRIGTLVERWLGADAGTLDQPDFPALGVELKTIPLDRHGKVRESTFVCVLTLTDAQREEWLTSRVKRKLSQVLWIPVERDGPRIDFTTNRFAAPRLWIPNEDEEQLLRADWFEIMGRIATGGIDEISAHLGTVLQVRPKAAHSRKRTIAYGADHELLSTVPRGFYLRARFTQQVLARLNLSAQTSR